MEELSQRTRIAVIGGGMTGLVSAYLLGRTGRYEVEIFEKDRAVGGLSSSYSWDGASWDRFYHVVLSTDRKLLWLLNELGLTERLFWKTTRTGFYGNGRLVSLSSPLDFIRFPFLGPLHKLRLAAGILYSAGLKDVDRLDRLYVRDWLTAVFGRRVYERIWDPLLRSKLGSAREQTSAAFIQATIKRLFGARDNGGGPERLGHVEGGYRTILAALERKLEELGVGIRTGSPVDGISPAEENAGRPAWEVRTARGTSVFDRILLTVPGPEVLRITGRREGGTGAADSARYWESAGRVRYLGVICLLLVLRRGLSPYYVTNLLDRSLPFTGIIEATNVVDPGMVGGSRLVYLPKYLVPDDPLYEVPDHEVMERFVNSLRRVHPTLTREDIAHWAVFRERFVQPIQETGSLESPVGFRTPLPGVYLVNSAMLYNCTLNNDAAIDLAMRAVEEIDEQNNETRREEHAGGYSYPSYRGSR